jgi:hypothetical protein
VYGSLIIFFISWFIQNFCFNLEIMSSLLKKCRKCQCDLVCEEKYTCRFCGRAELFCLKCNACDNCGTDFVYAKSGDFCFARKDGLPEVYSKSPETRSRKDQIAGIKKQHKMQLGRVVYSHTQGGTVNLFKIKSYLKPKPDSNIWNKIYEGELLTSVSKNTFRKSGEFYTNMYMFSSPAKFFKKGDTYVVTSTPGESFKRDGTQKNNGKRKGKYETKISLKRQKRFDFENNNKGRFDTLSPKSFICSSADKDECNTMFSKFAATVVTDDSTIVVLDALGPNFSLFGNTEGHLLARIPTLCRKQVIIVNHDEHDHSKLAAVKTDGSLILGDLSSVLQKGTDSGDRRFTNIKAIWMDFMCSYTGNQSFQCNSPQQTVELYFEKGFAQDNSILAVTTSLRTPTMRKKVQSSLDADNVKHAGEFYITGHILSVSAKRGFALTLLNVKKYRTMVMHLFEVKKI